MRNGRMVVQKMVLLMVIYAKFSVSQEPETELFLSNDGSTTVLVDGELPEMSLQSNDDLDQGSGSGCGKESCWPESLSTEGSAEFDDRKFPEYDLDHDSNITHSNVQPLHRAESSEKLKSACESSKFGCCPDGLHPAHGPNEIGCCASGNFSCCADDINEAEGPYNEGCDCEKTVYGCCPDQITPARGKQFQGCGCQYEPQGCCPDRTTIAAGPNFEGCHCQTFPHGCCPDGETPAGGPNFEDCLPCQSKFGCCPDGATPRISETDECQCHATKFGCCPDGKTPASGPLLQGCGGTAPGVVCTQPPKTGNCTNYVAKWYYDVEYGGCSRFWYGGCEPGPNHFDEEDECKRTCVSPRASGSCFLKKIVGPCNGKYNEWFFDLHSRKCAPFVYGGCLGNDNRFLTREDCEDMCLADSIEEKEEIHVCDMPKAEGPCGANLTRWFYNKNSGNCEKFAFSGCMGNKNRFMSFEECSNSCQHKAKKFKSMTICALTIDAGNCTTASIQDGGLARWAYDRLRRRCVPFYFDGCGGNENNFETKSDCEDICPSVFPPVISFPSGDEILLERGTESAMIYVTIHANPPADIIWKLNGEDISKFDFHFKYQSDGSLRIEKVTDAEAGTYTIQADNDVGSPVVREIQVEVFPIYSKVEISLEKFIFTPKTEVSIPCLVEGFPPPTINWTKVHLRRGNRRDEKPIDEDRRRIFVDTVQMTSTSLKSLLIINEVTVGDSGIYKCTATSKFVPETSDLVQIKIQNGVDSNCRDRPTYKHCHKIVKYRLCGHRYYGKYCCQSCTEAGYLPGGFT